MAIAFERQHHDIMKMLKTSEPYYQLPANGRHPHAVPHHIQMVHHQEMALRQQHDHSSIPHDMMVEMHPMAMTDHLGRGRPSHHSPEMQAPQGQMFGDINSPPQCQLCPEAHPQPSIPLLLTLTHFNTRRWLLRQRRSQDLENGGAQEVAREARRNFWATPSFCPIIL